MKDISELEVVLRRRGAKCLVVDFETIPGKIAVRFSDKSGKWSAPEIAQHSLAEAFAVAFERADPKAGLAPSRRAPTPNLEDLLG